LSGRPPARGSSTGPCGGRSGRTSLRPLLPPSLPRSPPECSVAGVTRNPQGGPIGGRLAEADGSCSAFCITHACKIWFLHRYRGLFKSCSGLAVESSLAHTLARTCQIRHRPCRLARYATPWPRSTDGWLEVSIRAGACPTLGKAGIEGETAHGQASGATTPNRRLEAIRPPNARRASFRTASDLTETCS
jgi:hypothetical protein